MAYREVPRMEIAELIRRWQAGQSGRRIAASTGLSRNTVAKYWQRPKLKALPRTGQRPARSS